MARYGEVQSPANKCEGTFDWLLGFEDVEMCFEESYLGFDKHARILVSGCGTSRLSERLYDEGFLNISNTDNLREVIEHMQARNKDRKKMKWLLADMTQPNFLPASFDVVLDKGTLDAMLGQYDLNAIVDMLCETHAAMVNGGVNVIISLHPPTHHIGDHNLTNYVVRVGGPDSP